jgi:D-alanyl-D-alanine carboxypeptidase (penicillin-binding protein 5/6)
MRIRRGTAVVGVVLAVLLVVLPALAVPGLSTSARADPACPFAAAPGPPVDTSEAPRPGQSEPPPLPIPSSPVGGPATVACGDVVADGAPAPPPVGVVSYVLADLDSGQILAARNAHARLRPASMMKTLTGLLVARRLPMDEVLTGTQEDADQEGTRVGIGPGGQYTVRQLLNAMLMASGNDTAHALAVRLTGSVDNTVALMNETARGMGALDTRAATPSGLDGPGMQTSAYDLASIFRVGMREEPFATATGTRRMPFPGFGAAPGFDVINDNKLIETEYPGAIGGKTGFTDDARHTYIGAAQRGGRRLVVVLMRGEQRPTPMYQQAEALLEYGFALPDPRGIATLTDGPVAGADGTPTDPSPADPGAIAPDASGSASWSPLLLVGAIAVAVVGLVALRVARRR